MGSGRSKSRSLRCAWLVAATVVTASARGDESIYNPTQARPTRVGELALNTGQAAVYQSGHGWTGAFSVGAAWGLWPIESLSPLTLRLELPVIEQRPGVEVGSLLATLGAGSPSLLRVGPLSLGATVQVGVEAPSVGRATVEVLGNAFAERDVRAYLAASIPLALRALGLSVAFWATPFANANFEVDYAPPGRSIALRAGIGLAATDQPSRWFAGFGVHLGRDLEIGVSASAASDPANAAVLGLSARWSAPTEATRTIPWEGVDARVLHPEDVEGRELTALAVPDKFTIVAMVADWCGVCRVVRPGLEQFARRRPVALRFVDIDENPAVAARYRVQVVPTYFILDTHARIVLRMSGINWKALDSIVPL